MFQFLNERTHPRKREGDTEDSLDFMMQSTDRFVALFD